MVNTGAGKTGERLAADYLRKKGYSILAVNFRCRFGEIDVIAQNRKYIAFVEVKTRGAGSFVHPLEAITPAKRARIVKTAQFYRRSCSRALTPPRFSCAGMVRRRSNTSRTRFRHESF